LPRQVVDTVTSAEDSKAALAILLRAASAQVEALHAELIETYPALKGTLAIPGMLVGYGLGSFVGNSMTDDQIVTLVRVILTEIRQPPEKLQS
jgi:hypothetical protein